MKHSFKFKWIFLSIISLVLVLLFSVRSVAKTHADDSSNSSLKNVFISSADLSGMNNSDGTFGYYNNMSANWNFSIPAGEAKSGDTIEVGIPQSLKALNNTQFDVVGSDNTTYATANVDASNRTITIKFNDNVNNLKSAVSGHFSVNVKWAVKATTNQQNVPVSWLVNGATVTKWYPVSGVSSPDSNEKLFKYGYVSDPKSNIIHWVIRVNYAKSSINNAVYTDMIGNGQDLIPGSVTVSKADDYNLATGAYDSVTADNSSQVTTNDGKFSVSLGDINDSYLIGYDTKINDNGAAQTYNNSGELTGNNINTVPVNTKTQFTSGNGDISNLITISGMKNWLDSDDQAGKRPQSIVIDLFQNGQVLSHEDITSQYDWKYSFTNLPKLDSNKNPYVYSVSEEPVSGYSASYSQSSDSSGNVTNDITNSYNGSSSESNSSGNSNSSTASSTSNSESSTSSTNSSSSTSSSSSSTSSSSSSASVPSTSSSSSSSNVPSTSSSSGSSSVPSTSSSSSSASVPSTSSSSSSSNVPSTNSSSSSFSSSSNSSSSNSSSVPGTNSSSSSSNVPSTSSSSSNSNIPGTNSSSSSSNVPSTSSSSSNLNVPGTSNPSNHSSNNKTNQDNRLPQTGETNALYVYVLGAFIVGLAGLLIRKSLRDK